MFQALDKSYGPVETCAMYLLIAISTSGGSGRSYATLGVDLDTRVAQLATDAFLNHPSAPQRTSTCRLLVLTLNALPICTNFKLI